MPGSQTYIYNSDKNDTSLQVDVEGNLETNSFGREKPVYFTDQEPSFDVIIKNIGDIRVEGYIHLFVKYNQGDHRDMKSFETDLDPGEETTVTFNLDLLAYQGTAILGVYMIDRDHQRSSDDVHKIGRSNKEYPLYTCMVYDRDYYRVNYQTPRFAQYASVVLSVLIVFSAFLQLI